MPRGGAVTLSDVISPASRWCAASVSARPFATPGINCEEFRVALGSLLPRAPAHRSTARLFHRGGQMDWAFEVYDWRGPVPIRAAPGPACPNRA
jgi:hypothetical protein